MVFRAMCSVGRVHITEKFDHLVCIMQPWELASVRSVDPVPADGKHAD